MAVLEECLNKRDMEKGGYKLWAMCQCVLIVPLWNNWSGVACSQVHGSPVLKAGYLLQHLQSSDSLGKIQNLGGP